MFTTPNESSAILSATLFAGVCPFFTLLNSSENRRARLTEVALRSKLILTSRRFCRSEKKKKTGPKRPPTEYNIFVKNKIDELKITNPELKNTQLMSKAAELWSLNKKERQQKQETNLET